MTAPNRHRRIRKTNVDKVYQLVIGLVSSPAGALRRGLQYLTTAMLVGAKNRARPRGWRLQDGFTLTEIIVAIAILSLSIGVLLNVISTSIRRVDQAVRVAEAGALAQSLLAKVGPELPLTPGETIGDFGSGFHWHMTIENYGDTADRLQSPVGAYTVSAEVTWNDSVGARSTVLRTLRLGARSSR